MTEYNYFCYAKEYNDKDSFQQKRYRVFNVEVGKEAYEKIDKIYHKLEFDKNELFSTRYQTAFKKMWDKLLKEEQQKYLDIPHFNKDIFKKITGVDIEQSEEMKMKKYQDLIDRLCGIKETTTEENKKYFRADQILIGDVLEKCNKRGLTHPEVIKFWQLWRACGFKSSLQEIGEMFDVTVVGEIADDVRRELKPEAQELLTFLYNIYHN